LFALLQNVGHIGSEDASWSWQYAHKNAISCVYCYGHAQEMYVIA
jgi:hypothetical protein